MPIDRRIGDESGTRLATPSAPEVEVESARVYRDPLPTEDRCDVAASVPVRDRATLTMVIGPEPGRVFSLGGDKVVVGRSPQCPIRIDDPGVSRRHAVLQREGRDFVILDQGSRNGTLIDGNKISSRQKVHDGARIGLGPTVSLRFAMADEAEERCQTLLYEASVIDALTGASNRKHLYQRLACELAFARRHDQPLSLLILDLDDLKKTNDRIGHLAGDAVLKSLSEIIRTAMRTEDFVARYGGDEFVIVARGIGLARAVAMAERLRKIVEKASIDVGERSVSITVSIGVASLSCCRRGAAAEDLIKLADERLYVAKRNGRNRVDFTPDTMGQVG
jgi:two-component system, cell cycle response regulator